ncbi:hypothetical protein CASFOL_041716 [Castilleja foliolosa]|uniref:Uncharacterized protein n=1 Tax=Castilleja foliolosa TaxID=1961234 RepID=A0ABD3B8P9_9LAMI
MKIIAMVMAIVGFASYPYQNYLDDVEMRKNRNDGGDNELNEDSC